MKKFIITLVAVLFTAIPGFADPIFIWPTEHMEGTWTTHARDHQITAYFRRDHEVVHSFFFTMVDNSTGETLFEGRMNATQYGMMGSFKSQYSNIHTSVLYTDAEGTHLQIFLHGLPRLEFFLIKTDQI